MTAQLNAKNYEKLSAKQAAEKAFSKIAPNWPLDKMIAVNPFWSLIDQPIDQVYANVSSLGGVRCFLPTDFYLEQWQAGHISSEALAQAAFKHGLPSDARYLSRALQDVPSAPWVFSCITNLADQHRAHTEMRWHDEVIHQISQFCASYYQRAHILSATVKEMGSRSLYQQWLEVTRQDHGLSVLLGEPHLRQQFLAMPEDPEDLMALAMAELSIHGMDMPSYFHALLLDINGWAAYVAYRHWQANLSDSTLHDGPALLAIRLAWELAIWRCTQQNSERQFQNLQMQWQLNWRQFPNAVKTAKAHQSIQWVWAEALELTEQAETQSQLKTGSTEPIASPKLQAIFCIDVRSEVIRRALEAQHASIQTLGFAGFFGLPIAYQAIQDGGHRPQLPGLLSPQLTVKPVDDIPHTQLANKAHWQRWGKSASGTFGMVESAGWLGSWQMLKKTIRPSVTEAALTSCSHASQWRIEREGQPLNACELAELVAPILSILNLSPYADTVMLVGHGSHSANNLQAAGLDCGACGGQTGEVNVRVLAQCLNDEAVRLALKQLDHDIPATTQFIAALHNTTTDEIQCFSDAKQPILTQWLQQAQTQAQQERANSLEPTYTQLDEVELDKKIQQRSRDWSQTRPEWGLANNKAFVIAPRHLTRQSNFQGRVFLHDYIDEQDPDGKVLELLMTAPMVVTHWINMQYNASVTDNFKYGSGNKVLHNAVGGNIGVFEGSGGDLRIGLALQSVHNGEQWMHKPQRLTVYIAADENKIVEIVSRHNMLQNLINNEWLNVVHWQPNVGFKRLKQNQWTVHELS